MDLRISDSTFLITGASSGFGRAISIKLLEEGAKVILNARRAALLEEVSDFFPGRVRIMAGDITDDEVRRDLIRSVHNEKLAGMVVNAGGPPAKAFLETNLSDWDNAWHHLVRWKIDLVQGIIPSFINREYGRLLFIESVSVKQPVASLALSNSLRLAVVGMVKTLSQEVAPHNVNLNILAPGYHNTPAVERVILKQSELRGTDPEEVSKAIAAGIPVGRMGDASELASLAAWLLSPHSAYITGQTISVDGGVVQYVFG